MALLLFCGAGIVTRLARPALLLGAVGQKSAVFGERQHTSASAYLDSKAAPTCSVIKLRYGLLACILAGLFLSVLLIWMLYRRNSLLLFSPTELSTQAQLTLYSPVTPDEEPGTPKTEKPKRGAAQGGTGTPPAGQNPAG